MVEVRTDRVVISSGALGVATTTWSDADGTGYGRQTQRVETNAPHLAGTGGADFYRADFVLKPDRAGKKG